MSRRMIAALVVTATVACADPGPVTSPTTAPPANVLQCTAEAGQQAIDDGQYEQAIEEFTCVIDLDPTAVEGYRGRIEAQLLLGRFSDAVRDYGRVTALVEPVHPDAQAMILAGYSERLQLEPDAIPALTGQSFAYWWFFKYASAIHVLKHLLEVQPNDLYGNLFRGSSRLLRGQTRTAGAADLERAIELAPLSPDVRYVIADAYTYGLEPDPQRAFDEATFALDGGLDTPRVRAILAASYLAFGDTAAAAEQIESHLDMVTTELLGTPQLTAKSSMSLDAVPGRTYDIPLSVAAGETVWITTSGKGFFDTILLLLESDGTLVLGSDDYRNYFAGFQWVAPTDGTYQLRVTTFEAVGTGSLTVTRK
jgi:Tetratricopeptide repeat